LVFAFLPRPPDWRVLTAFGVCEVSLRDVAPAG
jgi:hypothetical protein